MRCPKLRETVTPFRAHSLASSVQVLLMACAGLTNRTNRLNQVASSIVALFAADLNWAPLRLTA
jgi:hypothetical protein